MKERMMKMRNISTPFAVILTAFILIIVFFIVVLAATETDDGLRITSQEQQSMTEYYSSCPFKKAEQKDITTQQTIRNLVKFIDVSCDPQKQIEQVTVQLIGKDKQQSKTDFENWLQANRLEESVHLKINIEE
ncbi:MAG: hypothetical protein ABI425_05810 [Patescibacteria group bacterium]